MNIVLMAGGGGTRLWPLSRQATPKQFIDFGRNRTLIADAYQRACRLTSPERVYVAANQSHQAHIKRLLPDISSDRVWYEPEKRDTTAAFATVSIRLQAQGEGSTPVIFMWADHVFTKEDAFVSELRRIEQLLSQYPDHLVIMGHVPLAADTTLGYIEAGEKLPDETGIFRVTAFREKPAAGLAERFVLSGHHFWNLGYFSLRPEYLLSELLRLNPALAEPVAAFTAAVRSRDEAAANRAYHSFPQQALEYTVIEKTPRILVVTGDWGWSDVGNWAAVKKIFGAAGDHAPAGHHLHIESRNNYVYNATGTTVTMLGIEDTIVVVTEDAILITNSQHAARVKEVVQRLAAEKYTDIL